MRESDRQLIGGVALDDGAAVVAFIRQWEPEIARWVSQRAPRDRVPDYCQEVWMHLSKNNWQNLLSLDALYTDKPSNPHTLRAFIKRITINRVSDLLAADTSKLNVVDVPLHSVDSPGPSGLDPQRIASNSQVLDVYLAWYNERPSRDQSLLGMWHAGYTGKEIAEELGMTANNVRQRRFYLLGKLLEHLVTRLPGYFRDV